jgi:hypothetical protein
MTKVIFILYGFCYTYIKFRLTNHKDIFRIKIMDATHNRQKPKAHWPKKKKTMQKYLA